MAGVSGAAGRGLARLGVGGAANLIVSNALGGIASAGARSILTGTSFGDNVRAVLPDVIGQTVGNMIGAGLRAGFGGSGSGSPANAPTMTEALEQQGIPREVQLRIWEAEQRAFEASMNGGAPAPGDVGTTSFGPRYGTWRDWARETASSLSTAVYSALGIGSPSEGLSGTAIVVTGRRWTDYFNPFRYPSGGLAATGRRAGIPTVRAQSPSVGEYLRRFTMSPRIDAAFRDRPSLDAGIVERMNGGDSMSISMAQRQGTQNYMWQGIATFFSRGFDAGTGAAVAPIDMTVETARGIDYARNDPIGAAGGLAFHVTHPDTWFQGLRTAVRTGDAYGLGLYGTEAAIQTVGAAAGPGLTARSPLGLMRSGGAAGEIVIHGNSRLSTRTAYLYRLEDLDGNLLKYGITQNEIVRRRYTATFLRDKDIIRVTSGSRSEMLTLERQLVTQTPGPLNFEPWAVEARNAGRGR